MVLSTIIVLLCSTYVTGEPSVSEITPHSGSMAGGTLVTVHGKDFAASQFNFGAGNENKGNKVYLYSERLANSIPCDVHKPGSTRERITCYTRAMAKEKYFVRVSVDGEQVPLDKTCYSPTHSSCGYSPFQEETPSLEKVTPQSGPPGTVVELYGKVFTVRYDNTFQAANATNNNTWAQIKAVQFGENNEKCELINDDTGKVYQMVLDGPNGESNYGFIKCKLAGRKPGHYMANMEILPYGKTETGPGLVRVSSMGKPYMFQAYAEINQIIPNQGSVEGGTILTIRGKNFQQRFKDMYISVGGLECRKISLKPDEIQCLTAAKPNTTASVFPGNRGFTHETWQGVNKAHAELGSIASLSTSASGYNKKVVEDPLWTDEKGTGQSGKIISFFVPPVTGKYQIIMQGFDDIQAYFSTSADPADKKLGGKNEAPWKSETFTFTAQAGDVLNLEKGKSYYVEVFHSGSTNGSIGLVEYTTDVSNEYTNDAQREIQVIYYKTTEKAEVQALDFTKLPSVTGTKKEVQTITVNTAKKFRLGVNSVYTDLMTSEDDAATVEANLNDLASITPDTVTVTKSVTKYTVTFNSERGTWPVIQYLTEGSTSPVSGARQVAGTPSYKQLTLQYDSAYSVPVSSPPSTTQLKQAVESLLTPQCPKSFITPPRDDKLYHQNFEGSYRTNHAHEVHAKETTDAFCGRSALLMPRFLYVTSTPFYLSTYKYICFAYRGAFEKEIYIEYTHAGEGGASKRTRGFDAGLMTNTKGIWKYSCWNMLEEIQKIYTSQSGMKVYKIYILTSQVITGVSSYVDEIYIGKNPLSTPKVDGGLRRQSPPFMFKSVTVTAPSVKNYKVTITPLNCFSGIKKFTLRNVASSAYTVNQEQQASAGIGGTVDITWAGKTIKDVPTKYTDEDMSSDKGITGYLETIDGMGRLDVKYTSKSGNCYNFDRFVKWTTNTGDQPQLEISSTTGLTGTDATVTVKTYKEGRLYHPLVGGDFFRSVHNKPQVSALVNGLPTACLGDCSFEWTQEATPAANTLSPLTGTQGTKLTLTGSGFDSTSPANNRIIIDGEICSVTKATATQVECEVGEGSIGQHNVFITVIGKGAPTYTNGEFKFSYTAVVSGISPSSGSIGGLTKLTITGKGFAKKAVVKVGGIACIKQLGMTFSKIICETPPGASASSVAVTVEQEGQTISSPSQFTYSNANTPVVDSISAEYAKVDGTSTITIQGSKFGTEEGTVLIGDTPATIKSYTDTTIVVSLPAMLDGEYPLVVVVPTLGSADTSKNSIPAIKYRFRVSSVTPLEGSVYGGSKVTIVGSGFSLDKAKNAIMFGDHTCNIKSVTTSKIECEMDWTAKTHIITNKGTHPDFGEGYGWQSDNIKVEVGDIIRWQWEAPPFSVGYKYLVQETASAISDAAKYGGFSSGGTKTEKGVYKYKVTAPGTHYYWSGPVDEFDRIFMRGKIEVVDKPSFIGSLVFKIQNNEPIYSVGGTGRKKRSTCTAMTGTVAGCSDTKPTSDSKSTFNFAFWCSLAPRVTNISPYQGTSKDAITITGSGFGSQNCQNEVMIGDAPCVMSSSSDTSITCTMDPSSTLQVGSGYPVSVNVRGRGFALMQIKTDTRREYKLFPHVTSVSPSIGSLLGETLVTIQGGGFSDHPGVTIVTIKSNCDVQSVTYNQIICKTGSGSSGVATALVKVGGIAAQCKGSCQFTLDSSKTPSISSVSPMSISGPGNTVTVTGTGFGTSVGKVTVKVGTESCNVQSVTTTQITCSIDNIPIGKNDVYVHVDNIGKATGFPRINGEATISTFTPTTASTAGGILTIIGNGFISSTEVTVGGNPCEAVSVTLGQIDCTFPPHVEGDVSIDVTIGATSYTAQTMKYADAATPTVTAVSPAAGTTGGSVTITGTGFGSTNVVKLGGAECKVTSQTSAQIVCTIGNFKAGEYDVTVHVADKGYATCTAKFTYALSVTSVSPSDGSYGGGQDVTITGKGLAKDAVVTICGSECQVKDGATSNSLTCVTPALSGSGTKACDIFVKYGNGNTTKANGYTYTSAKTPVIDDVTPRRGGTGGGTKVTVTGSKFGTNTAQVSVTIGGEKCVLKSLTDTKIVCETEPRRPPTKTKVRVEVGSNGIATQDKADFQYIDVWSSRFTWGGLPPPVEGDFVVVPTGQTLLIDVNVPVLKMMLIKGGQVVFDDKDIELHAENILITDGGLLQIGTEEKPYLHKGKIVMHGSPNSLSLPIYGAKTLAVRHGTLDLHGKPVKSWTLLAKHALANQSTIELQDVVNWSAGDIIVIATTGGHTSQKESEKMTIKSVTNGGKTVILTENLKYKHHGETQTFADGTKVEVRAEVGLLTRNIVFQGTSNKQFEEKIEACEEGVQLEAFKGQTCAQGQFGEEMASDQFGAAIMFHQAAQNTKEAVGRLENVELDYVGQAYKLGRYPIHFHLNGDMSGSYVRGVSVHDGFNRAINMHNCHNLMIEHNFVYNIMGGAIFFEDGIEQNNTVQYNLAIFVRASSSLLNDDITPAAFWITHPNNRIRHNHAAGNTHFGFWYRMLDHPEGPSYDPNICPQNAPMPRGSFINNTAHSVGWYGLWLFEFYKPTTTGTCREKDPVYEPAVFERFVTWNAFRGAEWGECTAIQFENMITANHYKGGMEALYTEMPRTNPEQYTNRGAVMRNNVIIGHLQHADRPKATYKGLTLPFRNGLLVDGITFINFDEKDSYAIGQVEMTCICFNNGCGGWLYRFKNVKWINSPNKALMFWEHQYEFEDIDGTFSGNPGGRVITSSSLLPKDKCTEDPKGTGFSAGPFPAMRCKSGVDVMRFSHHMIQPTVLNFKNMIVSNRFGKIVVPWIRKREAHHEGWMALLVSGETHTIFFEDAPNMANFSYTGKVWGMEKDDYLILQYNFTQKNNFFSSIPGVATEMSTLPVTYENNYDGDWYWKEDQKLLQFLVSDNRSLADGEVIDRDLELKWFGCPTKDCKPPPDPTTLPPPDKRPENYQIWSDPKTWIGTAEGYGGNYGNGVFGPPRAGDSRVQVKKGKWIVVDKSVKLTMTTFEIFGVLEFEEGKEGARNSFTVDATYIIIRGRLIVGWPKKPFMGSMEFIMQGTSKTDAYPSYGGLPVGSKAIAAFGGLDLHGKPHDRTWTNLAKTAKKGDTTLELTDTVDWVAGDEIAVATSSFYAWDTETFKIQSVSSSKKVLTLNSTVLHRHISFGETVQGKSYSMKAEVGLLTRNIKVTGADHPAMFTEGYGARIVVGTQIIDGEPVQVYKGFARVCNVEFFHTGQLGYTSPYDPRYSLAYVNSGESNEIRPSFVKENAFHNGFAPALGVYGASNFEVDRNVIHHAVGEGVALVGEQIKFRKNLIMLTIWPAYYMDRYESATYLSTPALNIMEVTDLVLQDNVLAGVEQVGYKMDGESCKKEVNETDKWRNNVVHGSVVGMLIDTEDCHIEEHCSKVSGFTIYKSFHYGIFTMTKCSLIIENTVLADNTVGYFPMTINPVSYHYEYEYKYVEMRDSIVIGRSPAFDCVEDEPPKGDANLVESWRSHSWYIDEEKKEGYTGIAWPIFAAKETKYPFKTWIESMKKPPSIMGIMRIKDTVFAYFKKQCGAQQSDVVFSTCPLNANMHHPVEITGAKLHDIALEGKAFIHRPYPEFAAHGICGDMNCDTRKKAMIIDTDGSYLGKVATLIPQSEYQWDGPIKSHGIGDFRIPKAMLLDENQNRIDVNTLAPNGKGIIRNEKCTYHDSIQAYMCPEFDYKILQFETMDHDNMDRRFAPAAILGGGYIDVINGPRDKGVCGGYPCNKRLALLPAIVAVGQSYKYYLTGTNPQHSRIWLLNAKPDDKIIIGVYFELQQRVEMFYDGQYVSPKNLQVKHGQEVLLQGNYMPTLAEAPGTNWLDQERKLIWMVVAGNKAHEMKIKPSVIVAIGLPQMTADDFFGANLVDNLRKFLGISLSQIRIVNAVRETSRRRKRAVYSLKVTFEISETPTTNSTNSTTTEEQDDKDRQELSKIADKLIEATQLNQIGTILNATVSKVSLVEPLPSTNTSDWADAAKAIELNSGNVVKDITAPTGLVVDTHPASATEGTPFQNQPTVKVVDDTGSVVKETRTSNGLWQVTATLNKANGDASAALIGKTTVTVEDGWANFTDLGISHTGKDYKVDFSVTGLPTATPDYLKTMSKSLEVIAREMASQVSHKAAVHKVAQAFEIEVEIIDAMTRKKISDIGWRGHKWTCSVRLEKPGQHNPTLSGNTFVTFDLVNNKAAFTNLKIDIHGQAILRTEVKSDPAEYSFVEYHVITVYPENYQLPVSTTTKNVQLKFDNDYDSIVKGKESMFKAVMYNSLKPTDMGVTIHHMNLTKGSIIIDFRASGSELDVEQSLKKMHERLQEGLVLQFYADMLTAAASMKVEGQYYTPPPMNVPAALPIAVLIVVPIVCVILIVIIIAVVVIKLKNKNQVAKKGGYRNGSTSYLNANLDREVSGVDSPVFLDVSKTRGSTPNSSRPGSRQSKVAPLDD